jgi:hypothetical protein
MGIRKSPVLYGECMEPGCIGKSNTNNLPAPTDLNQNPNGEKKLFFKDATQKSASVVPRGIDIKMVRRRPIFEKCPHLREKGGVLTLKHPIGFVLTHTVRLPEFSKTNIFG